MVKVRPPRWSSLPSKRGVWWGLRVMGVWWLRVRVRVIVSGWRRVRSRVGEDVVMTTEMVGAEAASMPGLTPCWG